MTDFTAQVLGFDFGTKRIGVAYGQTISETTKPLKELKAQNGIPLWQEIADLIALWQPNCLLVGLPLNMDGSENDQCLRAKKFAKRLHGRFGLPCYLWDERLTSKSIKQSMPQKNYREQPIDSLAACAIIESWFFNDCPKISALN